MNTSDRPLIVGAGPVGLAAALFIAEQGLFPRVIEMRREQSRESRALAVNPRTLSILEPTGISRRMLQVGLPVHGVRFYNRRRMIAALNLTGIDPHFPFMLALSQATTEQLLTDSFEAAGGRIERGIKMVDCRIFPDHVEVVIEPSAGGPSEAVRCPWLLAADGARSIARQQLGIDFVGSTFPGKWHLADAPLQTTLAEDHGHAFFLEEGAFLFMIRVVDPVLESRTEKPIWRVLGNRPDPLSQLLHAEQAGPTVWESSFHISHRVAATFEAGRVYLAGDAAHVHSPVGARGMNLGIEDVRVFAELLRADRLSNYDRLRRPVDSQVVSTVKFISRIASGDSAVFRLFREFLPFTTRIPFIRARLLAIVAGLDHELPVIYR